MGLATEASHTLMFSTERGRGQGQAGGQLSETLAHRINGHKPQAISQSGFPLKLFIHCGISMGCARKQKATTSLFSISGAICSFLLLSAWTPAERPGSGARVEPTVFPPQAGGTDPTLQAVPPPPHSCSLQSTMWPTLVSGSL